jgi:small subunit ribosomal protein S16
MDKRTKRDGEYIEKIGNYYPKAEREKKVVIDQSRLKHWLSVGAQVSPALSSILKHIQKKGGIK